MRVFSEKGVPIHIDEPVWGVLCGQLKNQLDSRIPEFQQTGVVAGHRFRTRFTVGTQRQQLFVSVLYPDDKTPVEGVGVTMHYSALGPGSATQEWAH